MSAPRSRMDVMRALRELEVPRANGIGGRPARAVPGSELRRLEALVAVAELVAADREFDAAADELAEAKRAKGNWRVNPLARNHKAVVRMRAARARRAAALAAFAP